MGRPKSPNIYTQRNIVFINSALKLLVVVGDFLRNQRIWDDVDT